MQVTADAPSTLTFTQLLQGKYSKIEMRA